MVQNKSKYEFREQSTLSQQLSSVYPEFAEYAGADPHISTTIAHLKVFIKFGYLDGEDPGVKLLLALLNERRKALFATSERVNEITKMGMQMPRVRDVVEIEPDDDEE